MFYKRSNIKRAKINKMGLYVSTSYLVLTLLLKAYTYQKFIKNLKAQNINYNRIETGPTPLNAILWYANVETDDAYYIGAYSLFDRDDKIEYKKFDKNHDLRKKLKNFNNFKRMNTFSKNWYLLTYEKDTIYYNNVRFGIFGFEEEDRQFVFNQSIEFVENDIVFKSRDRNPKALANEKDKNSKSDSFFKIFFKRLINRIKGKK